MIPLFGETVNWIQYKQQILLELPQFAGWCTKEKAEMIMDFIYENKPKKCVEIGTFGGSTTYPIASALRFLNRGYLSTIDSWDNDSAIAGLDIHEQESTWWASANLKKIQGNFLLLLQTKRLNKWCKTLSMTSEKALLTFPDESLDMVYIDGNFSSSGTLKDVLLSFSKVKKGGYIWLNDADIDAKIPAVSFLMNNCHWLRDKSLKNNCIVFQK